MKLGIYDLGFLAGQRDREIAARDSPRPRGERHGRRGSCQQGVPANIPLAAGVPGDYAYAERLASLGAREAALEEFLKGYVDGNWSLNDQDRLAVPGRGDLDAAEKYWSRRTSQPAGTRCGSGRPGHGPGRALTQRATQKGFSGSALRPFLRRAGALHRRAELIQAARLEQRVGGVGRRAGARRRSTRGGTPTGRWRDEADWITGQLFEVESPPAGHRAGPGRLQGAARRDGPESALPTGPAERVAVHRGALLHSEISRRRPRRALP
ncbi:MAG: hypothetical protein MZU91_14440 [Desulfosudis oleivorans]|nr:hypothetical protein [Desulfosudis oleivorans]